MRHQPLIDALNALQADLEQLVEGCTRLVLVVQDQGVQRVDLGDGYILEAASPRVVLHRGVETIQEWEDTDIRSVYFAADKLKTSDFVRRKVLRKSTTKQERS